HRRARADARRGRCPSRADEGSRPSAPARNRLDVEVGESRAYGPGQSAFSSVLGRGQRRADTRTLATRIAEHRRQSAAPYRASREVRGRTPRAALARDGTRCEAGGPLRDVHDGHPTDRWRRAAARWALDARVVFGRGPHGADHALVEGLTRSVGLPLWIAPGH